MQARTPYSRNDDGPETKTLFPSYVRQLLDAGALRHDIGAKSPVSQSGSTGIGISPGDVTATPDMWFYEQSLRQYNDPKTETKCPFCFDIGCGSGVIWKDIASFCL